MVYPKCKCSGVGFLPIDLGGAVWGEKLSSVSVERRAESLEFVG